ncbi:MAG TPA: type II toxin-antitoxin system PemK/MazF family toxin [Parafilimonas sp.]|nr:type II toxin-antitoxin system PemK/MazF family toxin [Parafilimonas sp.]
MQTGNIIVVDFPFSDYSVSKVRPAVVVNLTNDKYKDVIVCFIGSVIPSVINNQEIILHPNLINNLRAVSIIKIYRIATIKNSLIASVIWKLNDFQLKEFKSLFKSLVD